MVDNILVSTEKGIITEMDLSRVIEEYIDKLPNGEMIYKNFQTFSGLCDYIGNRLIKPILPNEHRNDYMLFDSIFNHVFCKVSTMFGYTINIMLFCTMINTQYQYIYNIYRGIDNNGNIVNKNNRLIIKKWFDRQELSYVGAVSANNSIGNMFLLKSKYAYSETSTVRIESAEQSNRLTVEELEQIAEQTEQPTQPFDDI